MKKSVIGIGSALVDILTRIDDDNILKEINIPKGSMQLVDEKSSAFIEKKLENNHGIFFNPEVFNVNQKDVDEFDENFEYREKLVLEGQLGV